MMEAPRLPSRRSRGPPPSAPGGVRVVRDPLGEAKPEGWTRFVCFSDTHGREDRIPAEYCYHADVLLHAGDFTNTGETAEVKKFAEWLRNYPAAHKVVIAGNHDVTFEPEYYERAWVRFHPGSPQKCEEARKALIDSGNCTYLQDESVEVLGYLIYGSPWQPEFCDWAFNLRRGAALEACWDRIPDDTDILITHGPPHGMGDHCDSGLDAGCAELLGAVQKRAIPINLAGHIHEGYGTRSDGTTLFVNASTCTLRYRPDNPPIVLDVPPAEALHEAFGPVRRKVKDRLDLHASVVSKAGSIADLL